MALFKPYKLNTSIDLLSEKALPSLKLAVPGSGAFASITKNANATNNFGTQFIDAVDEENFTRMNLSHSVAGLTLDRIVDGNLSETIQLLTNRNIGEFAGGLQVETGSYNGAGTYSASNYNSLTFTFDPKIVLIYASYVSGYTWMGYGIFFAPFLNPNKTLNHGYLSCGVNGQNGEYSAALYAYHKNCSKYVEANKELRWWTNNQNDVANQLNASNIAYHWIALG